MHTEEEVDQANVVLELLLLDPEKTLSKMSTSSLLKSMAMMSLCLQLFPCTWNKEHSILLGQFQLINYLYQLSFSQFQFNYVVC